ncbi:hypothetical protein [Lysinibacillus sp. fls2-241-R2A-57]|uniref:hypothetical protein n=1 Tax=Lysinibacillus sp. fls2-241-R2A-57 TaxID=3040292 RepID=UPI002557571C|nr:hypothetical protein [Lysinibacillus sp. fls2-241-R2A-57]
MGDSHDQLNKSGWINDCGYSIWFEGYDCYGGRTIILTDHSVIFHKHTNDFKRIDVYAEQAIKAYEENTDSIPY